MWYVIFEIWFHLQLLRSNRHKTIRPDDETYCINYHESATILNRLHYRTAVNTHAFAHPIGDAQLHASSASQRVEIIC